MPPREECPRSDHRAPAEGGSCACGMVTRIPAAPAGVDVRDVLARCLDEGAPEPPVLQQRVDRVLAAFAEAGLVIAPDAGVRSPA